MCQRDIKRVSLGRLIEFAECEFTIRCSWLWVRWWRREPVWGLQAPSRAGEFVVGRRMLLMMWIPGEEAEGGIRLNRVCCYSVSVSQQIGH
jgi:hypothetical protein